MAIWTGRGFEAVITIWMTITWLRHSHSSRDAKLWILTQKNMVRAVANIKHFDSSFYFTSLAVQLTHSMRALNCGTISFHNVVMYRKV